MTNSTSTFTELITRRRSIRKYTSQPLSPDEVAQLLQAGLLAPTSRNSRSNHFIAVEDPEKLALLSKSKRGGCKFIAQCPLAIIVAADPLEAGEVWLENTSVAATFIQLQAEALGLGSCWIQIHGRQTAEGYSSEEYVKEVIQAPLALQVLAIITVGYALEKKQPHEIEQLPWENVHTNNF